MARKRLEKEARETLQAENSDASQEIKKCAYDLFQRRGCLPGNDLSDWFEAEKRVKQGHDNI
jgi:hypothetical protein